PTPLRQPSPRPPRPHRGIRTSRRRNRRAGGLVAAALAVVVVGSGCAALTGDTGADEADQFLAALTRGDVAGAAALPTDPAVVVRSGCAALAADPGAGAVDQCLPAPPRGAVAGAAALTTDPAAAEETILASVEGLGLPGSSAATSGDDGRPDRDQVTVEITW